MALPAPRHALPLAAWPESDRAMWSALWRPALRPLELPGGGAHWSQGSRRMLEATYGQWLTWLQLTDPSSLESEAPLARITQPRMVAFVGMLQETVSSNTALLRMFALRQIAEAAGRHRDWAFFKPIVASLWQRRRPARDKSAVIVPARDLYELGWALMRKATTSAGSAVQRAVLFRDGLMIALLISIPLRKRNFSELCLGHSLLDQGDGFTVRIAASETKARRPLAHDVPAVLNEPLRRYLAEHRPRLLGAETSMRLWITYQSRPMSTASVHDTITTRTSAAFGHAICPHLFRDCAATSIGEVAPAEMRIASQLLGHAGMAMTERHYNHAGNASVHRRYQQAVLNERKQASAAGTTERSAIDEPRYSPRRVRAPRQLPLGFDTLDGGAGAPPIPRTATRSKRQG